MPLLSSSSPRLSSNPSHRRAAIEQIGSDLGWPRPRVVGHGGLVELIAGGEPKVLFVDRDDAAHAVSLAYTREAPYLVAIGSEHVQLHASRRWRHVAGDTPLAEAALDDRGGVDDVLGLISRESVLLDAPADVPTGGTDHRPLHDVLGAALKALRAQVAEMDVYRSDVLRDTAVLRLFHQILYVRVLEDRGDAPERDRIRDILALDDPASALAEVLSVCEKTLDSGLFRDPGIPVQEVPPEALRGVLAATVEPWERLRLDFSVSRTELASRLYESYLRDLPVRREGAPGGRLFDVAETIDAREQQATFYTPPALAALLAQQALGRRLAEGLKPSVRVRVVDPACGSGAFLVAAYRLLLGAAERGHRRPLKPAERESLLVDCLFGADVDERALGIARVQLLEEAHLGARRLPSLDDNLLVGDALRSPPGAPYVDGAVPWGSIVEQRGPFDCVLTNPPFGAQAKLPRRLSAATVRDLNELYPEVGAFGQDLAYLFVALARRLTRPDGSAGFVLPRPVLNQDAGRQTRALLASWGLAHVGDFRGAKLFPRVGAAVCTVAVDPAVADSHVVSIRDSRVPAEEALDALAANVPDRTFRVDASLATIRSTAPDGLTPFRLRWRELSREIDQDLATFGSDPRRVVRTGIRPARVDDFVIAREAWSMVGDHVEVDGHRIAAEHLPEVVRSGDLKPFRLLSSGDRLILPYERGGALSGDARLRALIEKRGGVPGNFQRGDLDVLLGPKVLLTGVAREPAAAADVSGDLVPMMRGVHALRVGDFPPERLPAIAALLQSAFFQWLLRGFSAPRADETVEVTTRTVAALPWPDLGAGMLDELEELGQAAQQAMQEPSPIRRIHTFAQARRAIDELAFDAVGATTSLRALVADELLRIA